MPNRSPTYRPRPADRNPSIPAGELPYHSRAWRKLRALVLAEEPCCGACSIRGRTTIATVADHLRRHAGNTDPLFWERANLWSLCASCHGSKSRAELDGTDLDWWDGLNTTWQAEQRKRGKT